MFEIPFPVWCHGWYVEFDCIKGFTVLEIIIWDGNSSDLWSQISFVDFAVTWLKNENCDHNPMIYHPK